MRLPNTLHNPLPNGTLPPSTRGPLRLIGLALLAALALLAIVYAATPLFRPAAGAVPLAVLEVEVPTGPVATLDRVDLGARVGNTGGTRAEDVSVELTVTDPTGNVVMRSRQTGIDLNARETRAVRWGWRVPGHAPSGDYTARVVVTKADGTRLATSDARPATFAVVQER